MKVKFHCINHLRVAVQTTELDKFLDETILLD